MTTPEIEVTKYSVKGGGNAEQVTVTGTPNEKALLAELEQTKRRMSTLAGERQLSHKKELLYRGKGLLTDEQMTELIASDDPRDLGAWDKIVYDMEKEADERNTRPDADNPPNGSLVSLERFGGNKVTGEKEYDDYRSMVDDLYKRSRDGDEKAGRDLDRMWVNAGRRIKDADINVSVSGCPRCSEPMLRGEGDICPRCGFDVKPFVKDGGELF